MIFTLIACVAWAAVLFIQERRIRRLEDSVYACLTHLVKVSDHHNALSEYAMAMGDTILQSMIENCDPEDLSPEDKVRYLRIKKHLSNKEEPGRL